MNVRCYRNAAFRLAMVASLVLGAACAGTAGAAVTLGETAPVASGGGACSACQYFQIDDSGSASYIAPSPGVITSYSIRTGGSILAGDNVQLRIMRVVSGATWDVAAESDLNPLAGLPTDSVTTFPARVAVSAGDHLGLKVTIGGDTAREFTSTSAADVFGAVVGDPAVGESFSTYTTAGSSRLNAAAILEPDQDGDGFGDETQDLCSNDGSRQTACAISFPADQFPPVITFFKSAFKRFRYLPNGVVASRRAHRGTTISMNLSEAAHVTFTVEKAFRGKRSRSGECQRPGQRNRKGRRCTRIVFVHAFARDLLTGPNSFPYSARYFDAKGKIGTLRFGPYRMTAIATDAAGNAGPPKILSFKVRQ